MARYARNRKVLREDLRVLVRGAIQEWALGCFDSELRYVLERRTSALGCLVADSILDCPSLKVSRCGGRAKEVSVPVLRSPLSVARAADVRIRDGRMAAAGEYCGAEGGAS